MLPSCRSKPKGPGQTGQSHCHEQGLNRATRPQEHQENSQAGSPGRGSLVTVERAGAPPTGCCSDPSLRLLTIIPETRVGVPCAKCYLASKITTPPAGASPGRGCGPPDFWECVGMQLPHSLGIAPHLLGAVWVGKVLTWYWPSPRAGLCSCWMMESSK